MQQPLLSICIPTYKRPEILKNTLNSIYSQTIDHSLFEVCISDDSPTDETRELIEAEFSKLENLIYKKTPECGFLNLFEALKLGRGQMLKLLNDYAALKKDSLKKMIALVESNAVDKPLIYFGLHVLKNKENLVEFEVYNDFIRYIDYQCTFCSSISVWKSDLDKIIVNGIEPNHAFPHTTLLFRQTYKEKFVIDNFDYVINQQLSKKGGYNLPEYFVKEYLTMIEQDLLAQGFIDRSTYGKLERNILRFTAEWYWKVKFNKTFTFSFENYKKIIQQKCGNWGLVQYECYLVPELLKWIVKPVARKLLKRKK